MAFLKQMFGITNSNQNKASNTLNQAQQAGIGFGRTLQPQAVEAFSNTPGLLSTATGTYNTAGNTLNTALDFYRPLVSGNRSAMMSVLSPEVKQISSGYDTALANERELTPRSGTSTATAADLPFRRSSTLNDLLASTRLAAVGQLPSIANILTGVGAGQTGVANANTSLGSTIGNTANESLNVGTNAASSAWQQQLRQLQQQFDMYVAFGKAMAGMMGG